MSIPPRGNADSDASRPREGRTTLEVPHIGTLPPPSWSAPRSVSALALDWLSRTVAASRHRGGRAEIAVLRSELDAAEAAHDGERERAAATALARALASQGAEFDEATKLARHALMLGEDPSLREELSLWFAGLGETALAAATLRPLLDGEPGVRLARILTRVAVFLGRTADARGAAEALARAAREDPDDPVACELRGAIAAWAADAVSAEEGAAAYLEGSRRRQAAGDSSGAFEDLLRAFEMAPQSPAAEALADALTARGRVGAADIVLSESARASAPERARTLHLRRIEMALAVSDLGRALAAALDAGLDAELEPEPAIRAASSYAEPSGHTLDALIGKLKLYDWLAARLELVATTHVSTLARAWAALGHLCAGPLGDPERAAEAWIRGLCADPGDETIKAALREHAAATGDYAPLVEGLIRVTLSARDEFSPAHEMCVRELMILADQRLGEPTLALWAADRIGIADDEQVRETATRLAQRAHRDDQSLAAIRSALEQARGSERVEQLRLAAAALKARPDAVDEYVAVLSELYAISPDERSVRIALERALARSGRWDELEVLLVEDVESGRGVERARSELALLRARSGRLDAALEPLRALLTEGTYRRASGTALAIAGLSRDASVRAPALAQLASTLGPATQATLTAVAGELFFTAGAVDLARAAAEQACHADASQPRAIWTLARATLSRQNRLQAVALERAMGIVVPRGALCHSLADTLDALGEPVQALAWTQRWLALRPGDLSAAAALLRRATVVGDAARLGDALGWLLAQPQPLISLAPLLSAALCRLAELDDRRGAALARRMLDVFGARVPELRDAVLAVADTIGERGLALATLERQLASGVAGDDRPEMLLDLARRRRHSGDADGAARTLVRALREGADAAAVLAELDVALPPRSSDGELALLEARAEAFSALSSSDLALTASAWRRYGAAQWDLALDRDGAVRAWEHAAALDSEHGIEDLARDLVTFGGHSEAIERLTDLARRRNDDKQRAKVLAATAAVAFEGQMRKTALDLAVSALELDPSEADVLGIAELSAADQDLELLDHAYQVVADGALGVYGARAAHYRAARQLERRGERRIALRHAIRAFEAVPAEGVTFVLMTRLAERTGEVADAVLAVERVASRSDSAEGRAAWLRRAALVAGQGPEGKRLRVDVLLRAVDANPQAETLRSLGAAIGDLVRSAPDERDVAELRFDRALSAMAPRLAGPEGARAALEAAGTALGTFASVPMALRALSAAVAADASMDEYAALLDSARWLATATDEARAFVNQVTLLSEQAHNNVGHALRGLAAALGAELSDRAPVARLLDEAALMPVEQRVEQLLARARAAQDAGDVTAAIEAIEAVLRVPELSESPREEARRALKRLYLLDRRPDALEVLLREDLERVDLSSGERIEATLELAALLVREARADHARRVLGEALATDAGNRALLNASLELAQEAQDTAWQVETLERLAALERENSTRIGFIRRGAELLLREGDEAGAMSRYARIFQLDPSDEKAFEILYRNAQEGEEWSRAVELLDRRTAAIATREHALELELERAELLELRLGRLEEARGALERLLAERGDQLPILMRLADLNDRMGATLRAAPLWLRASALPADRTQAAELARRACRAYLEGGEVDSARRVFGEMRGAPRSPSLVALRVDIERRSENPRALAEALEEMALSSMDPAEGRAALLNEAARAALAAGDFNMALGQAQRAARIASEAAGPQLFARLLEYRHRGAGDPDHARQTVLELRGIRQELTPQERELWAFLLAEALDRTSGAGYGMAELTRAQKELGSAPLVALGLAERLAYGPEARRSLPLFEAALAGDLRGVRQRGEVAMAAAQAARRAGDAEPALRFLELAASLPESRAAALRLQAELREARRPSEPPERIEAPTREPQAAGSPAPKSDPAPEDTVVVDPELVVPTARDGYLEPQQREAVPYERPRAPPWSTASQPEAPTAGNLRAAAPPKPPTRRGANEPEQPAQGAAPGREPIGSRRSPSGTLPLVSPTPADAVVLRRISSTPAPFPPATATEDALLSALSHGNIEAGKELIRQLENRSERTQDLVTVCRRVAFLLPGDGWTLQKLYEATLADRNVAYARAIEHVLHAFDPAAKPVEPPPLGDQLEQPDHVQALLFRDTTGPATDALGVVWGGAQHLFRRDPTSYGVTGLERVAPGAPTPLAQVYGGAARLLGMTRTPLFQRKSGEAVNINVALLSPPALILTGEVRKQSPALAYHLGAMLAATMPQFVLLYGAPETQVKNVLRALTAAFGRPQAARGHLASVATLAEMLWESIPASSQRHLRELCDDAEQLDYDVAIRHARQAIRRSGLFVSGDLLVAVRQTCGELAMSMRGLESRGGLSALCASSPAVADLVRLATSAEFADARWQTVRSGGRRSSPSWGSV